MSSKLLSYLSEQRRSSDWNLLITSLLNGAQSMMDGEQFAQLLSIAGMHCAQNLPLPPCDSLTELELSVNVQLSKLGWGVSTFSEHPEFLQIDHQALPQDGPPVQYLAIFLAGLYQQWLHNAGASESLHVRVDEAASDDNTLVLRLEG